MNRDYEILRLQMPITRGPSGGPVIDDTDHVVGVVVEEPALLTAPVAHAIQEFEKTHATNPDATDVSSTVENLAWVMAEFWSPGAGLAVPIEHLK